MKTILSLLLLAVVTLIHCQEHEQMIVFALQGVLEKLEGITDTLKGYETMQQKQDEIMDKLMDMQEKLDHMENNLEEIHHELEHVKELHHELEHVKGISQETRQCLQGDELEHLTNVSAAAHQEIKSFVHEEISGVISLAQRDECSEGSQPCGSRGTCTDTLFSFTCSCPSGFTWDGSECADINECIQGNADCSSLSTCINSPGNYSCSCNPPSEGDGRTCSCPPGFASNGDICEDIEECAEGNGACSPNALCKNSIGSYSCSCNKPFVGDGLTSCEFQCRSPATVIRGLGCVKRVKETKTFAAMEDFCREEGWRLLQHFKIHHLNDKENFGWGWVGVYDEKWMSDESLVPEDLWKEGHRSDPSRRCGFLITDSPSSSLRVIQLDCSEERWGYCQFQLP